MADFEREEGNGDPRTYQFVDGAGSAIDITGWEVWWTVNKDEDPPDTDDQVANIQGTLTDAVNGRVSFPIPPWSLSPGNYFYDIRAKNSSGEWKGYERGKVTITATIGKNM